MAIEFYLHKPAAHAHESESLVKLAQALRHALALSSATYVLAANLDFWRTQIDAILLAPQAVTLIELKSCAEAIHGGVNGPWLTMPGHKVIRGGQKTNPFEQVSVARNLCIKFLDENRRRFMPQPQADAMSGKWGQVSAAIVVSPFLHPASQLALPAKVQPWLRVLGLNEVMNYLTTRHAPQINLQLDDMRRLVNLWRCEPWTELDALLPRTMTYGHLWLLRPDGTWASPPFPIADAATLGRSSQNSLIVPKEYNHTSRFHARLQITGEVVWLYDNDSLHGTFVNGQPVNRSGCALNDGDHIYLGDIGHPESCQLRFERRSASNPHTTAVLTTRL